MIDNAAIEADEARPARWCVLRMAGPRTLVVRDWLRDAGIAAWTPSQVLKRRRPRSTATHEIVAPIAATFVFAPADDVGELRRIMADPYVASPAFSLLRHRQCVVELRDRELDGLRLAEEAARPKPGSGRKARPDARAVGSEVQMTEGAFAGMTGLVESSDGRRTLLDFGGLLGRVEIETDRLPMAA